MEETNNRYKLTSSASYFFILPNKLDLRFSLSYPSSLKEHFSSFKFPQKWYNSNITKLERDHEFLQS